MFTLSLLGGHLAGLEVAFSSMKKKEKSRFLIKPQYAYGKMGSPPRIPEDAVGKIIQYIWFLICQSLKCFQQCCQFIA